MEAQLKLFNLRIKYRKGATIPTGRTEFRLQTARLRFQSKGYQWLVVAGPKAQFRGSGTINGRGNYGFMLTVMDAKLTRSTDVDLFRIVIWDKDDKNAVIYDSQPGDGGAADPTTEIGGGSIVIHE